MMYLDAAAVFGLQHDGQDQLIFHATSLTPKESVR